MKSSKALAASTCRMVRVIASQGSSGSSTSSTVPSPRSVSSERSKLARTASSQPVATPLITPNLNRRPATSAPS